MATLRERLIEAIVKEAVAYPGDECSTDEGECIDAHVHMAWSIADQVKAVLATPERIADLTQSVFADVLREWAESKEPGSFYRAEAELSRRADQISGLA